MQVIFSMVIKLAIWGTLVRRRNVKYLLSEKSEKFIMPSVLHDVTQGNRISVSMTCGLKRIDLSYIMHNQIEINPMNTVGVASKSTWL